MADNHSTRYTGRQPPEATERLIGALYDLSRHRDAATLGQRIVTVVSRIVACDSAIFARIQPATRTFTFVAWPERSFDVIDHSEVIALHLRDHPLVAHFAARRDAHAWSLHDLVSESGFRRTPLYRRLYRPHGIEYQLAMLIPSADRDQRVLALNRRLEPFSEDEKRTLELTWPHFAQAVRVCRSAWRQSRIPEVDNLPNGRGVIVLNRAGKVELCTEQARIWLTRYCIQTYSGREIRALPEPIEAWVAGALTDRALQARGIGDPSSALILRRGDQYLGMRLVTDHGRGQHLVLMEEAAMNSPPDLLLGLGLTPREAEVLAWVAQGKTNRETAMILGASTRTVQKHLERVFAKLGVESRTAAILKAWQAGRFEDLATQR